MSYEDHEQTLLDMDSADYEAERLILDATELILRLLERQGITKSQLADRIGKSKGHVSQLLNGERNMTLRTLAEIAHALNQRINVNAHPLRSHAVPDRMFGRPQLVLEALRSRDHDDTLKSIVMLTNRIHCDIEPRHPYLDPELLLSEFLPATSWHVPRHRNIESYFDALESWEHEPDTETDDLENTIGVVA